ncbi:MAG: hypothetical protein JW727_01515 [Candidatus Aenigmarchaeota archaeon]|nr:hypothetical protein [Candidatus Aenigmarchaeota archaeon]
MNEWGLIALLGLSNLFLLAILASRLMKEREIRQDAIEKSRAVLEGKFREQLAPVLPDFGYNPTDVRFLGSPVDFVVFDGLAENSPRGIVLLEVKSGEAKLTEREKMVRGLVREGKVHYRVLRV